MMIAILVIIIAIAGAWWFRRGSKPPWDKD